MKATKVIFRKITKIPQVGEIIAYFPEIAVDLNPAHCSSYMHTGQHGAACGYLGNDTVAAKEGEYVGLYHELIAIGYENLKIIKRFNKAHYAKRHSECLLMHHSEKYRKK